LNVHSWIQKEVKRIPRFGSKRVDCPFCGGIKTLSITNSGPSVVWNCFRASCPTKGSKKYEQSIESLRERHYNREAKEDIPFIIPQHFVPYTNEEKCVKYFEDNNCLHACKNYMSDLRYDVRHDRAIFLINNDQGMLVDAAGRYLGVNKDKPKWLRYAASGVPYTVVYNGILTIVEDCASANACYGVTSSMALLGTKFLGSYFPYTRDFNKIIIALDEDAFDKAVDIQRFLDYYIQTEVVKLERDLKYESPDRISEILKINK